MSKQKKGAVIELSLTLDEQQELLITWLLERGISDFIEASCDFLDSESAEAAQYLADYEAGKLQLPLLLYSYDSLWITSLRTELVQSFGAAIQIAERQILDELWQEAWEPGFHRLETQLFSIGAEAPSGAPQQPPKHVIRLESGTVFGSGQHATTQALIRLMESHPRSLGGRFLDVGTGTGILGFVAYHLGYREIWCTDIEAAALAVARHNQQLNGIELQLYEGSLPPAALGLFDTVACNILPPTLTHLLAELVASLKPGGLLYLAGINEANEEAVLAGLRRLPVVEGETYRERGWLARSYRSPP